MRVLARVLAAATTTITLPTQTQTASTGHGAGTGFFGWPGWSFFVAVGTLALAFFTWRAVRGSGRQIELQTTEVKAVETQTAALTRQAHAVEAQAAATARQAEVSAAALEAASRPVLVALVPQPRWRQVDGPLGNLTDMEPVVYWDDHSVDVYPEQVHYDERDDMVYCSIPLRNVGAGVAFIQSVTLVTRTEYPGRVSRVVVPRDETTRALFAVKVRDHDGRATDASEVLRSGRGFAKFVIRVVCTGSAQGLVTTSEIETSELPRGGVIFTRQRAWNGLERTDEHLLVSTDNVEG